MIDLRAPMLQELVKEELRLILRNRTTRYVFVAFPLVLSATMIGILWMPDDISDHAPMLFMVSVYTPLTYLSLAVSWNATHADALFGLPLSTDMHVRARLLAAGVLSIPVGLLLTAMTAMMNVELVLLPAAATMFSLSAAGLPVLFVAVRYPSRFDVNAPPFADFRKFRWPHYLVMISVFAPAWVLSAFLTNGQFILAIAGVSLLAAPAVPYMHRRTAAELTKSVPAICRLYRR